MNENTALDLAIVRSERRGRFVLYDEISTDCHKEWLVDRLIGHAEFTVIFGHPSSGKSAFVEDVGLRIAAGLEVHGRPVRRGAVLYVALERRSLVERRVVAFRNRHKLQGLPFGICGGVLDLRQVDTANEILAISKELEAETGEPVVLVVVDTLNRALAGGDENSSVDMGKLVACLEYLRKQTGAGVLCIHHMPKQAETMRGHGSLLGAADTTILVNKSAGSHSATVIKANDAQEGQQIAFAIEAETVGSDGTEAAVVVPVETWAVPPAEPEERLTKNQRTVFGILHDAGASGLTTEEWNDRAREAGIGVKRRADLVDIRSRLKSLGMVSNYGDRWTVRH